MTARAIALSFAYDATGRRNGKTINGTTTNFLYDGANAVQELAGGAPSANLLTGLGIDEVFSRTDSLGTRSFVTDALGSTVALTDGSGAVKTSYAYEPYGNTVASGEANSSAIQYTGRENDGTGLYYFRARYYHPGFGRFVAQDRIGLAGGNNVYAYVGGDPENYTDQNGEQRGRPMTGDPDSCYVHPQTGDRRYYGSDGAPLFDLDVSHTHDGLAPHIHVWRNGTRGEGEPLF